MGRRLRIFVSSTMKDLANERQAVCRHIEGLNYEPVNAENLGPSGGNSWERIQPEIASSDMMVLILGERYGWIPKAGPGAELNVSVTELEVIEAQKMGIPILPFMKNLDDDADRTSEDAKRRDAFRKKIRDWGEGGFFVQTFDLAADLAVNVGKALMQLLADEFQQQRLREHAEAVTRLTECRARPSPSVIPSIPAELRAAVAARTAVLFAGSGISLSAGFPSAAAFSERFVQLIEEVQPSYSLSPAASAFAAIATDLEFLRDRHYVTDAIRTLMDAPQHPQPTPAHEHAVRLFSRIVTTNYDTLFERAAAAQGLRLALIANEIADSVLPDPVVVKLHGSSDAPESLMVNERDILLFDQARPRLWEAVRRLLREQMVVVVGSSLRDPSIIRLFTEVGDGLPGYFVGPVISLATRARLRDWNLQCIEASSDDFLAALAREVGSPP